MGKIISTLLVLLAFFIPLSTSAVSVLAVLIVLFWLLEGDYKRKLSEIVSNKVCVAVLLYLALYVIGLLWSSDISAGVGVLKRHWKIFLMPVFLTALPIENRRKVIYSFLAGLLVMVAGTYLALFDLFHYGGVTPEHPTRNLYHVVYNPMLAFGCYLVIHEFLWGERSARWRGFLGGLALVMILNMFITEGRAGQVAFFVLMTVIFLQLFKKRILWGISLAVILLPLLFTAGYNLSPNFQNRMDKAWLEISTFNSNPQTSIGYRIQFWKTSWEIFKRNPLIGVGTSDFKRDYALMNFEMYPRLPLWFPSTDNPHNQYVLVACQLGLLGLAALLGIFFMQLRHAYKEDDSFKRIRYAFILFFLTIMLAESYFIVNETGFLFSLFCAVLYKKKEKQKQEMAWENAKRHWLILSFRSNIDGSACSQHIDDRLPLLLKRGIVPVMLTGTIGDKSDRWPQFRSLSLAPSGIRFELRHFLRKKFRKRWQFKLVETILLLPVLPFYLIEKIIINLESEWSWFISSSIRGYFLCRRFKPEVIYSTSGTASAHVAADIISRLTGIPWIAETQDPLMHDYGWRRGRRVKAVYLWLEKRICSNADVFLFLVEAARHNMAARSGMPGCGRVIYPGANPEMFQDGLYEKRDQCHFAHFGTLDGTRNLVVFLKALRLLIDNNRVDKDIVRVDVYGSLDGGSRKAIKELGLEEMVTNHGMVLRKEALVAMQKADCLLLIQNTIFFSSETIPSKVYEYLLCGRPVLGFVHHNPELDSMLQESRNFSVPADQVEPAADAIEKIVAQFKDSSLSQWTPCSIWTVEKAVDKLIHFGNEAARRIK